MGLLTRSRPAKRPRVVPQLPLPHLPLLHLPLKHLLASQLLPTQLPPLAYRKLRICLMSRTMLRSG
jgi:hypothetical protein